MGVMKRLSEQMTTSRKRSVLGQKDGLPFEISLESVSAIERYKRAQDPERQAEFNRSLKGWCDDVTSQLKSSVGMLVKKDERLSASISAHIYKKEGEVYRIGCF